MHKTRSRLKPDPTSPDDSRNLESKGIHECPNANRRVDRNRLIILNGPAKEAGLELFLIRIALVENRSVPYCFTAVINDRIRLFLAKDAAPEAAAAMYSAWCKAVLLQVTLWSRPYVAESEW